ncbi:MAG TPA: MFS transporter [Solirubrobacteraceae bacterium]
MTSPADIITPAAPHRQHYGLTFAVLALGAGTYAVLQSLVAPALPEIQRDLHTSTTAIAWILTAYLLSASVFTPIVGRLGDMFGKERTLIYSLGLLAAGSLLAALATNITVLIAARVIQGCSGAIFPLSFGIIRDEFPRERIASGIALISAILGIGGGLGIVLAGPIVSALSYHWLFWIPFFLTVIATVMTVLFVPESPIKVPGRVNWLGAFLLSGWLVCLLIGISEGSAWGWGDPRIVGLFAATIVLLVAWIRNEQRAKEPLVDMTMMRIRGVWTVNAAAFLVGAGMYLSFILIPEFTETQRSAGYGFGASVTQAGLFLLPATVMMLIASPLAGRMTNRVGARVPLIAGSLATCVAFAFLAAAHDQRWEVYVATALLGVGIGLAFASLANLIVQAVPPDQTGVATGMNTVMRTLGGSVGSQIGASVIAGTVVGAATVPTEHGFTVAFIVAAAACGLAALASLAVPRPGARSDRPASALVPDSA